MKRDNWTMIGATLIVSLFFSTVSAWALDREALKEEIKSELKDEIKSERGVLGNISDNVRFSGLIEFGGAAEDVDNRDGTDVDRSDLALTTVELSAEAEVNEWVNAGLSLLYEDATYQAGDAADVILDAATITIGNTDKFPLYFSAGAMYVPFGALLTHFPDDPLIDVPLTLPMGETREKAALLGLELMGFALSAYAFNGDMDETGEDNEVESYGFDGNYSLESENGLEILIGASYISNIADSDGLTDSLGLVSIIDYVGGFDGYLHTAYAGFFFDAEYMTATDDFDVSELATGAAGTDAAQPAVWNFEAGYNLDWGKNLEIALKYAGTDESDQLGYPEKRYGIALNQEVFEGVVVSLAYINDDYEENDVNGVDERKTVFGQLAVEF